MFSGNSLLSRGTTFESSTCDYSDDLQILLESGGEGGKTTKTEQMILKLNSNPRRMLASNTEQSLLSLLNEFIMRKGGG